MTPVLVYNKSTQTIRQMPENYGIAYYNGQKWLMEPDFYADKELILRVTLALLDIETKYSSEGLILLSKVTPNNCHGFCDIELDLCEKILREAMSIKKEEHSCKENQST